MPTRLFPSRWPRAWLALLLISVFLGCSAHVSQTGGSQSSPAEEHEISLAAQDAYGVVEAALRGKGILFSPGEDKNTLETFWQPADKPVGFFASLIGIQARYRYELRISPVEGSSTRSKVDVTLDAEGIPENELDNYRASKRLDLFHEIDMLAQASPQSSRAPRTGGVNFTLLPNEDLKGLAQRATGNPQNWREIAKDNGLNSPTDVTPFQTIWVRKDLLKPPPATP